MVSVARYLFVVINVVHIAIGLVLTAFGFWLQYASPIREILNSYAASLSAIYLTIVVGFFLVAYGAVGSFGDVASNKKFLGAYIGMSAVIISLEIAALAYGYTQKDTLQSDIQSVWTTMPIVYQYIIQDRFNCCGFTGPEELNGTFDVSCLQNASDITTPWNIGCYGALLSWVDENAIVLAAIVGLLLVFSFFQVIFSAKLLWNLFRRNNAIADDNDLISNYDEDEKAEKEQKKSDDDDESEEETDLGHLKR